jgi:hypothetical protein
LRSHADARNVVRGSSLERTDVDTRATAGRHGVSRIATIDGWARFRQRQNAVEGSAALPALED